jgi:hypothetical protein
MVEKPSLVVIDYETSGLEYFRDDFEVLTAAFLWELNGVVKTVVREGKPSILAFLQKCKRAGAKLICHNYSFEYGVTKHQFPGYEDLIEIDTMRLLQVADNGGKEAEEQELTLEDEIAILEGKRAVKRLGLSLQAGAQRWCSSEWHNHKERFYELIRERGVKNKKPAEQLNLLTREELIEYNTIDVKVTWELYKSITKRFEQDGYRWELDHEIYKSMARLLCKAEVRGIRVDKEKAVEHIRNTSAEMERVISSFKTLLAKEIAEIEVEQGAEFNTRSTKQLAKLFIDKLGMKPTFRNEPTKKMIESGITVGSPSFRAKFLHTWGEGGVLLKKQKTLLLQLKQGEALLENSELDGRWHLKMKAASTRSGRLSGGSHE